MGSRKKSKPKKALGGFSQAQVDAAVAARDRAASGNPRLVRKAFLGGYPIQIDALKIGPLTIGAFWLLEEIGSSFACQMEGETSGRKTLYRDVIEAAFILDEPRAARAALQDGRAALATKAFDLARKIPASHARAVLDAVALRITEAMDTMPPPSAEAGGGMLGLPSKSPGLGWGLVLYHNLLSTYGGQPDYWKWECPLPEAFVLFASIQASAGVKPGGPSYAEQEILDAIRAAAAPKPKK